MRTFAKFLLLIAVSAVFTALLTYPVWSLTQQFAHTPIHRVMHRVGELFVIVGLVVLLRHLRLANRKALGYGIPRSLFIRQLAVGYGAGLLLMMPLVVALLALQLRTPLEFSALAFIKLAGKSAIASLLIGVFEETFFRGAMYSSIERESGAVFAITLPTVIYAAAHFVGGELRVPNDQVTFASGVQVVTNMFDQYAQPLALVDSFLALFALGVLLSLVRKRTGAIAGAIGLHAAGVTTIMVMRDASVVNVQADLHWLVGSYDGVIGWMACAWISVVTLIYWRLSKRKAA